MTSQARTLRRSTQCKCHRDPQPYCPVRFAPFLVVPPQAGTLSISDDCDFWAGYFRDGATVKDIMSR
jgi:hypothetical protein